MLWHFSLVYLYFFHHVGARQEGLILKNVYINVETGINISTKNFGEVLLFLKDEVIFIAQCSLLFLTKKCIKDA